MQRVGVGAEEHAVAHRFFEVVQSEAERRRLLSDDHFTVDGTLLEAWASVKTVHPKNDDRTPPSGRNQAVDFHGQRRSDTHQSTTDPAARLAKKHHAGLIVRSEDPKRVDQLLDDYTGRFLQDFYAFAPAPERPPS